MKVKNLLLGSAAGLVVTAGAQAADLPARRAAPVVAAEYVRICTASGTGFFVIPGTDTCLRVSGRVRAEYRYFEPIGAAAGLGRGIDATGSRARGRLNIDAITPTSYGNLRTYFRYEMTANTGNYSQAFASVENTSSNLDKAFIQFAGLTAGRVASFFDFYGNDLSFTQLAGSDLQTQNVLAYTTPFGGGVTATIGIEDSTRRRTATPTNTEVAGFFFTPQGLFAGQTVTTTTVGGVSVGSVTNPAGGVFIDDVQYGGQRAPDVVANLQIDQPFGTFKISGAAHQIFAVNRVGLGTQGSFQTNANSGLPNFVATNTGTGDFAESDYGYAIQAGVKINLPQIAQGDVLWLQGAFGEGALSYVIGSNTSRGSNPIVQALSTGPVTNLGRLGLSSNLTDAVVVNGDIKKTEAFSFVAAFQHFFRPDLRGAVFGSYAEVDYSRFAGGTREFVVPVTPANPFGRTSSRFGFTDAQFFAVGGNLIFSPVRGLDIGAEVAYHNVERKGRTGQTLATGAAVGVGAGPGVAFGAAPVAVRGFLREEDALEGRIRVQRDF